jgi:glycosyltransferase involved in cell wall biosynthesis
VGYALAAAVKLKFSIVIPCWEQGAFLGECLASVRAQTHAAHEIIVVDDGSRDPWTIARIDAECAPPVVLVRQANAGLAAARNAGIARATGDFVVPLDADDQLTPDALAEFAAAIAREPSVDVWYPDVETFGLESGRGEAVPFNRWLLLARNPMVATAAIRRSVFDACRYNERMRGGYEDWELMVHALAERGFRARALERAVFRYRKWGHSMLSGADDARAELRAQLERERPIYRDRAAQLAIKRDAAPCFAIAARSPRLGAALAAQELQDFRVVDERGRVLGDGDFGALRDVPARAALVSLADAPLAAAFEADPYLLEKLARALEVHAPALLWLVAARDRGEAYPGMLVPPPRAGQPPPGVSIGLVMPYAWFLAHPTMPRSDAGLLHDLATFVARRAEVRCMMVAADEARRGADAQAVLDADAPAPALVPIPSPLRERVTLVGEGLSRVTRGVIGPARHDLLWQRAPLVRLRDWLKTPPLGARRKNGVAHTANAGAGGDAAAVRVGPIDPAAPDRVRTLYDTVAREPALLVPRRATDAPALLVAVPGLWHGGADRAVIDFLHGVTRIEPSRHRYLVTTLPTSMKWADQLLPHIDGAFSLPDLARDPARGLVDLVGRLGVTSLLIMHSRAAFEALAALRRAHPRLRVVTQLHCFDPDPLTGAESGYPVFAASRYNNLLDAYATVSQDLADQTCARYYVSPTKMRAIHLGIDVDSFARARRPRWDGTRPPNVLWIGRVAEQKNPLLFLRVVEAWRRAHGANALRFTFVGGGELDVSVRDFVRARRLDDVLTLVGPLADPRDAYRDADCVMLTSRWEGIPVVIYEAMACGLPIVTPTRATAIREVLGPDEAYFIDEPDDVGAYVRALERMVAAPRDAAARGERLAARAGEFGLDRYARDLLALLFP